MRDLIEYLVAILDIKTNSNFVILDITNEIKDIEDLAGYRDFMRRSFDYLGMEYYTGFQKFIKLTAIYKRQYAKDTNKQRISKSVQTASILAKKVKAITSYIEDGKEDYNYFVSNEKPYFSKFEISQLQTIGGLRNCVRLQKSVSGDDVLLNRLKKQMQEIIIIQALPCLEVETDSKVAKMIGAGFRSFNV
jgi:ribonuclease HII